METLLTFLPLTIFLGIGLLLIIPKIIKDKKESGNYKIHHNYANVWIRFVAMIFDFIIISLIFSIIRLILSLELKQEYIVQDFGFFVLYRGPVVFLISFLYFTFLESSPLMGTLGKGLLKIKVTDLYGNKISFGVAIGRYFGKVISSLFLGLGYFMAFFMSTNQALHDVLLVNTCVIKKPKGSKTQKEIIEEEKVPKFEKLNKQNSLTDLGLVSSNSISQELKVPEEEIIKLIESGQLKGKKIGDSYFILKEELNNFFKK